MATEDVNKELDISTEAKIKAAARVVFHKNGFAGTRTRDIAEEAGINLALLNYYFRSKQKLFDIIMMETMQGFFKSMTTVFNDEATSLEEKIELIAERYIDLLIANPQVPIFLLNELRSNSSGFIEKSNMKHILMGSAFFRQVNDAILRTKSDLKPLQLMINIMSLVMFPFVGSPILRLIGDLNMDQFNQLMLERKNLIPIWIKSMLT